MKQQLIILSLILTTFTFTYAQNYNIEWSEPNEVPPKAWSAGSFKTDDGISMFFKKNETYYSHIYNSDLELQQKVEFEVPLNPKYAGRKYLKFIQTKNQESFALYSQKSKDQKNWTLYASPIKNGKIEEGKEVFSIQKQNAKHLLLPRTPMEIRCKTNADKSEVMYTFLNTIKEGSRVFNYEIVVAVFDEKMNLKWSKLYEIEDINNNGYSLVQSKIDMNGEVHLLLKKILAESTLKKARKKKEKLSLFTVYSISQNDVKQHDIMLKDELQPFVPSIQLPSNQESKLIVNGGYINNKNEKNIDFAGTFFIEIDTKTGNAVYKLKAFKEKITLGSETRSISSFLTDNGGYVMALEDLSITTVGSGQDTKSIYTIRDIYLIYFNKDGKYLKTLQVNKQKGSYSPPITVVNNKIYIIYNNTKSKRTKLIVVDNKTMSILHEQELKQSEKRNILQPKKFDLVLHIDGAVVMYRRNGNKYALGKLSKE